MKGPQPPGPAPRPGLWRRAELRLGLVAGLTNGFAWISGLPFGYYATLAVTSVMADTYGGSLALGRQRVLGTIVGGLIVICFYDGLAGLPFPLGVALALGLQRLLGGLLGWKAGYKVGGIVIVMGWLVHNDQLALWLPLRLAWTVFGVIVALLSLRLLWPATAVARSGQGWGALMLSLAPLLDGAAAAVSRPGGAPMAPRLAAARRDLMALRAALPALRDELGGASRQHPALALQACLDASCSRLLGLVEGVQSRLPRDFSDEIQILHQAEADLLASLARRMELWGQALGRQQGLRAPRFEPPPGWHACETLLDDPAINRVALVRLQHLAARHQLCRQAIEAIQHTEGVWLDRGAPLS
jgi:hypothetical protein